MLNEVKVWPNLNFMGGERGGITSGQETNASPQNKIWASYLYLKEISVKVSGL